MEKLTLFLKAKVSKLARKVLELTEPNQQKIVLLADNTTNGVLSDMEKFRTDLLASQINSIASDLRMGINTLAGRLNENTERLIELTTTIEVLQNDLGDDEVATKEENLPPMTMKWPEVSMVDNVTKKKRNGKVLAN